MGTEVKRIEDYDVIGFDMDFCLINYNKQNLLWLQYEYITKYLQNSLGYIEIDEYFIIEHDLINLYFKCVVDLKFGTLLKMGMNGEILRAFKGNRWLHTWEIKRLYGNDCILQNFSFKLKNPRFDFCLDFYKAAQAAIFSIIAEKQIHYLQKEHSYIQIYKDMNEALHDMFWDIYENKESQNYKNLFNIELFNNCQNYILKTHPGILERFLQLRQMGKKLFLVSNNFQSFGEKMLEFSIGKNFRDYFDFLIFEAQKPKFMEAKEEIEFTEFNSGRIIDVNMIEKLKIVNGGNLAILNDYFRERLKSDFQGIIFEDNFYCGFENKDQNPHLKQWDYCLIFRELNELDLYEQCEIQTKQKQIIGSYLIDHNHENKLVPTFFIQFINEYTQKSFYSIDSPKCLKFLTLRN